MSKELVHQLGGNIAKKMVKEASKLLKTTEKWVIGSLTSSSILFWVGIVALLVFVVWKPWEHLTFEPMCVSKKVQKIDKKNHVSSKSRTISCKREKVSLHNLISSSFLLKLGL